MEKVNFVKNGYGKELVIDLHECDPKKFNRKTLRKYFRELCDLIDMQRCELYFWDDVGVPKKYRMTEPHLKGTSAIQFIMTSNVTIHTLDLMKRVYLNIFSCKEFDAQEALAFSKKFFRGRVKNYKVFKRI